MVATLIQKMKKYYFALIFIFLIFASCKNQNVRNLNLSSLISISANGQINTVFDKQFYYLSSEKFDIYFDNKLQKKGISIFAYHSPDFQHKYKFPIKADDTEIFRGGCARAEAAIDKEKGYTITIDNNSFSYIYGDRKIDTENGFMLPVRYIADTTGKYTRNLYLSFFADFNNNKIIEENEYTILTIYFPLTTSSELDFSPNKRAYFTSMGNSFKKDSEIYRGSEFKVYKINSYNAFLKICQIENKNLSTKTFENIFLHYYEDKNLTGKKNYLCLIPEGYNQIGNTFRLKGSSTVYLEVEKDKPEHDRCVNIRSFHISDRESDPKVIFYFDGNLIEPQIIEY